MHGPKINRITTRFSSRDSLGIESVAASISGELCPVVNTVTPRAFYWAFLCWIYYDFYKNSGITEWERKVFDEVFLKRQDYYFVLANLLIENSDRVNLVGKQNTDDDIRKNPQGPYPFNPKYFIASYGGMQYYNAGCLSLHLIIDQNEETGETYHLPRLTQYGEEMAIAFEKVIRDTEYYKKYRLNDMPVPRNVLEEYGKIIRLDMKGFDECKSILRRHMFELQSVQCHRLFDCARYERLIYDCTNGDMITEKVARYYLYDYFSPKAENNACPDELQEIVRGWELVIGRQYFTAGIEMIWKHILSILNSPSTFDEWSNQAMKEQTILNLDSLVRELLPECNFDYKTREQIIAETRGIKHFKNASSNGLRIALSVYNRFINREDIGESAVFLDYGKGRIPGTGAISINEWIDVVKRYLDRPVRELLMYIMQECVVEQHKRTCFEKITRPSQSVDGYYFEFIDGKYVKNEHVFQLDFQGIRLVQLMQVMKDLDMLEG
jgi:hypothetical protein